VDQFSPPWPLFLEAIFQPQGVFCRSPPPFFFSRFLRMSKGSRAIFSPAADIQFAVIIDLIFFFSQYPFVIPFVPALCGLRPSFSCENFEWDLNLTSFIASFDGFSRWMEEKSSQIPP